MKVLVIGAGGREHALAWKLAASPKVQKVFVAPGNGGTARDPRLQNVVLDGGVPALADFAQAERVALTVVGPEGPLADGVVDAFRARGLRIFGPTRAAARLESSKAYAKDFMQRHGVPTALYATFTDAAEAHAHVERHGAPIVVKADGLAAGKGVVVAASPAEAHAAIDAMLGGALPQAVGEGDTARVVIEECLEGEEASFIVLCDGRHVLPLATSQDHKRLHDGDLGPNTGGMGAYSPAPVVTPNVHAQVMHEIIQPTLAGMARDGVPFTGFLYAGLMIDAHGQARTVEFNCRMGDPETQPIMTRLKSDFVTVLEHACNGTLDKVDLKTLQVTTSLPIASGRLDQGAFFAGDATTRGGLQFINLLAFRQVTLTDLKVFIDFADPRIEANIQGSRGQKVKLFKIDISGVQFGGNGTDTLELNNNKLLLTDEGATLLNDRLRTKVFTAGAVFGTANTTFNYTVAP